MTRRRTSVLIASLLLATALARPACGRIVSIERPGDREFIADLAGVIDPADEEKILGICDKLLTETMAPIIVVTIDSMAEHGGRGLRIETFAMLLFNHWGIGHVSAGKTELNHGILLLVSTGDRKARIELGAGWGRGNDHLAKRIMDEQIVPSFKRGDFSGGIVAGVGALDKMARGFNIPGPSRPWWHYALVVGAVVLGIWSFVSLLRSGASGWAWVLWAVVFSIIGYLLYQMLTSSRRGGGGFSGGSFGGGFSGGGGATGSW
ncbi:MAG: TPM domain-containing protein [Planctomycetota bacterium]|jgi:uncharacterized protein